MSWWQAKSASTWSIVLLLSACPRADPVQSWWGGKSPEGESPGPPAEPVAPKDPELVRSMHERFAALDTVVPALVGGDVEQAKKIGETMLERITDDGPASWAPHVEAFRDQTEQLASGGDLPAVALATARVAASCGGCHEALGAVPDLPESAQPELGEENEGAMRLHAWSVGRLWEGLVGPSGDRWLTGTATFAVLPGCEGESAQQTELCEQVKRLANRAHVAESKDAKVQVYGELLVTCAGCHASSR